MSFPSWNIFLGSLRSDYDAGRLNFPETARFRAFVQGLPASDRVPLLLHAYERYKALGPAGEFDRDHYFGSSVHSILISTILGDKLNPSEEEACAILENSFHYCGHGCDVDQPVEIAEKIASERPYSVELFDGVNAYRETLRPVRSIAAQTAKRKIEWILWHDARHSLQGCWTSRMRSDIAAMKKQEAFHWQWLLRNTAGGLNAAPGKSWLKEGKKRLALIGDEAFLKNLDAWFSFPAAEAVRLSPAGSCMLRVLVWYASLTNVDRSLPILVRVADVNWHKREPAQKIVSAVAWLLRTSGDRRFEQASANICKHWASESSEVARLQQVVDPKATASRAPRPNADASVQDVMRTLNGVLSRLLRTDGDANESADGVLKIARKRPTD